MYINDEFMDDVGLGDMPANEKQAFMEHAEAELEIRVGQGVGMHMTDAQMQEFESITDTLEAKNWLDQVVPNYREIVAQIYQNFKQEIANERQKILS